MKNSTIFNAAFNMTIKRRSLWLLAFVAAFTLSGFNYVLQPFLNLLVEHVDISNWDLGVILIGSFGIGTLLGFLSVFLNARGNSALVASIDQSIIGFTPSVREGWALGKPAYGKLLGWTLLYSVLNMLLVGAMMAPGLIGLYKLLYESPALYFVNTPEIFHPMLRESLVWIGVGIPTCCLSVMVSMFVGFLKLLVDMHLVIKGVRLGEALKLAWHMLRDNFKRVLGFGILLTLISIVTSFAIGIVNMIPNVLQDMVMTLRVSPIIATGGGFVLGLFMFILMTVYNAFFNLFNTSAWVYLYRSLESKPVVMAEVVEEPVTE